jgi:molybdate transport system regulatory protein
MNKPLGNKPLDRTLDRTRLMLRVDFGPNRALGPGKIRLLEAIDRSGSISQAGRALGMSYRRAWLLIDDMNRCFREPVVSAQPGGSRGGGANLTEFGRKLVRDYRAIEADATAATQTRLRELSASLRAVGARAPDKVRRLSVSRAGKSR